MPRPAPRRVRWAAVLGAAVCGLGLAPSVTASASTGLPETTESGTPATSAMVVADNSLRPGFISGPKDCPRLTREDFTYTLMDEDRTVRRPVEYLGAPVYWSPASDVADTTTALSRAVVRLRAGVQALPEGCGYLFSLASYDTQGSTWQTSGGAQQLLGYTRGRISATHRTAVLGVPAPRACGQVDLYIGRRVYDGQLGRWHGPAPSYDDGVYTPGPTQVVSAWNGCAPVAAG